MEDVFVCDNPGCRRRYEGARGVGEAWVDLRQHKGIEFMVYSGDDCPACCARGGRVGKLRLEGPPTEQQ